MNSKADVSKMPKFEYEYSCKCCGKLLFKSDFILKSRIQILSLNRDCKTMNVFEPNEQVSITQRRINKLKFLLEHK